MTMKTAAVLAAIMMVTAGCGSAKDSAAPSGKTPAANGKGSSGTPAAQRAASPVLRVGTTASMPAPVQLPGLARTSDGRVIAVGGLDAADTSMSDVTEVLPAPSRRVGHLPQAVHDVGATAIGTTVYVFGGGTAAGPVSTITAVDDQGRSRPAGHLPVAMSDTTAVTLGDTAYVVGGYTTTTPLRSVLAYRPGQSVRVAAGLPHPVRYPAVGTVGNRLFVAGGTTGTQARREIVEVDPVAHKARVVGHLPQALAHAAGVGLNGSFYILGGRTDSLTGQQSAIYAFDPATHRLRHAGHLPQPLSDLAAVADNGAIVVAGGRDRAGKAQSRRFTLRPETPAAPRASKPASKGASAAANPPAHGASLVEGRIPPLLDPHDVYAAGRPGLLAAATRNVPARVYVPNSQSATVDVIDQASGKIIRHFNVGRLPQHVTPSWDLRTLWVTNDLGNSLTPVDPRTSRPGHPVPVLDPYNLYFTADGQRAIVVAEAYRQLDFRDPHTMKLRHSLKVPQCAGVDHMDYTADGRTALVSCEFAGRMIVVDLQRERLVKTIDLRTGAMPQDVKLSPDGKTFYVADMASNGVWLIDAGAMTKIRLQPTGRGAHGLYPSRDSRVLYVSNRGEGSVSVISFATRRPFKKWHLPGGGSPDMGGVSADGRVLWLSGRYDAEIYAISTATGKLLHRIKVGSGPHGMAVWPQPGRYSIGHTGILR
jgi:DNA-binding beta-propeller fold protein YncE